MPTTFGLDRLLNEPQLRKPLIGKRLALLAHPASVTPHLTHALDALATHRRSAPDGCIRSPARPAWRQTGQHGPNHRIFSDPRLGIPISS